MLAELFDAVTTLATKASRARIERLKDCPLHYMVMAPDGTAALQRIPPIPKGGFLNTLDDVETVCTTADFATAPAVYYDHEVIQVVCDIHDRREVFYLQLTHSMKFLDLKAMSLEGGKSFTQREAIRWLRRMGADSHQTLIKRLRNVDFHRRSDGTSNLDHGKESLGRAVEASCQNADEIPDFLSIRCPVWITPGTCHPSDIKLTIDIDLDQQRFDLAVLPDEIDFAVIASQETLGAMLRRQLGDSFAIINGSGIRLPPNFLTSIN